MAHETLTEIEDAKMWLDMGRQSFLIYQGSLEAGATQTEARILVREFYAGLMMGAARNELDKNEEDNNDDE